MKKINSKILICFSALVTIFAILLLGRFLFSELMNKDAYSRKDSVTPESTLIYGRVADVISLDPPNQWDGTSSSVINNIYENLVQFKEGTADIEPWLAESWEISKDMLEYTFKLRKNIYFHDKTQFNADSVVFNIERQLNRSHSYRLGSCECFESNFSMLESIKKIDDYTVCFKLKKPYTPFIELLAMAPMAIVSSAAVKNQKENFYKNPCGTGPFVFKTWIPNDSVVIERNDNYWNTPAKLKKIIFKTVPDNKLRLMQLYSGLINVMDGISPEDVDAINRNPEVKLLTEPGLNIGYIAMNMEKPPFNKREVRLAINHAINKKAIINFYYQQASIMAVNPMPPNILGYNNEIKDYDYDVAKATEYLKLAGLENGFTTKLFVLPITTMAFPEPEKVANAVIANLKDIGIKVEKYSCDWVEYQKKVANGEHEMVMYVWSADIPDPDNFLYLLLDKDNTVKGQAQNVSFYTNEILHYTLMKAQSSLNRDERQLLYKKAQELIHEDVPWIPMTHANQMLAHRKNVKNIKLSPVTFECYKNVEITSDVN